MIELDPVDVLSIFVVCGMIAIGFAARYHEKIAWNNGICAASGYPWVSTDMDSQGCRYYTDGQGNSCWISYNVDKFPRDK